MRLSLGSRSLSLQAGDCSQGDEVTCARLHSGCRRHRLSPHHCVLLIRCWQYPCFLSTTCVSALTTKLKCLLIHTGSLWTRLGSASKTKEKNTKKVDRRAPGTEEDDSELQRAWGALIKEKEQSRQKKSRLDNLPSLQIEVSRESSSGSEAES